MLIWISTKFIHNTGHYQYTLQTSTKHTPQHIYLLRFLFVKSFDAADHDILLQTLFLYFGIESTPRKLYFSHLYKSYHSTKIDKSLSTKKEAKCGVPQGSYLSFVI